MRFRLEATEEELHEKGERLVEALSKALTHAHPSLADILEKALPTKEVDLKYPVLRGLKAEADKEYAATLKRMLADIGEILDAGTMEPQVAPVAQHKDVTAPKPHETKHTFAGGKIKILDVDDASESPAPAKAEAATPTSAPAKAPMPSPEQDYKDNGGTFSSEEDIFKSDPSAQAFYDYTQPVVEADERMYRRVKRLAVRRGYQETDFEEGGPLYGWSTNEILDLLHEKPHGDD